MVLGGLFAGGCAMVSPPPIQVVQVTSHPSGSALLVNGIAQEGHTPLSLSLSPHQSYDLRFEKTCYAGTSVDLKPSLVKRDVFLTVYEMVNQLPPTVHVTLTPTCADGRTS
jgi:hypothetical protein